MSKVLEQALKVVGNRVLKVQRAQSELELQLKDGRSEYFKLNSTCPVEFIVKEPQKLENGETIIDLEILKFEVEAYSKVLWPGEKVKMSGGRSIAKEALPIYGQVRIPEGKKLSDGVESEQKVYLQVETPIGVLHNVDAIPMVGKIQGIPPVGVTFRTTNLSTQLYDENMNAPACANTCGSSIAE